MTICLRCIYLAIYYTLFAAWNRNHDETLDFYLSNADPYLWKDGHSTDPAVWKDFVEAFKKRFPEGCCSEGDAHAFALTYLSDIADEYSDWVGEGCRDFVAAFERETSPETLEHNLRAYRGQVDEG